MALAKAAFVAGLANSTTSTWRYPIAKPTAKVMADNKKIRSRTKFVGLSSFLVCWTFCLTAQSLAECRFCYSLDLLQENVFFAFHPYISSN
jgi:hypothetical protein